MLPTVATKVAKKLKQLAQLMEKTPEKVFELAVKRMLPRTNKSALSRSILKKLKVYAGIEHPHIGQISKNKFELNKKILGESQGFFYCPIYRIVTTCSLCIWIYQVFLVGVCPVPLRRGEYRNLLIFGLFFHRSGLML